MAAKWYKSVILCFSERYFCHNMDSKYFRDVFGDNKCSLMIKAAAIRLYVDVWSCLMSVDASKRCWSRYKHTARTGRFAAGWNGKYTPW